MIMADVLKIFLLVVGMAVVIVACWLFFAALAPRLVTSAARRFAERPVVIALVGLLAAAPVVGAGIALLQGGGPSKAVGFLLLALVLLVALAGSAGLAQRLGDGLPSPADAGRPWRRVLRGGVVLVLVFLLPLVGWFLLLPLVLGSGVGAVLLDRLARRRQGAGDAGATAEAA